MLFYDRPPLGYALCGAPPVGWVVAIEWIGRLYISAYSRPFFLGSGEHRAAIAGLEKPEFREPLDLTSELHKGIWAFDGPTSQGSKTRHTSWTRVEADGGLFYKIKTWDAVLPRFQKRAALAYAAYNKALEAVKSGPPPEALVRASLHFGCARLAVRMPFLHGTSPTQGELASEDGKSPLAVSISRALLWLAANDLLYTDLLPPNVLVLPSGQVRLIDYDDMRIVPGLGALVESQGVAALTAAFADGPGNETDFTRSYPGIRAALAADLDAERAAKRACHAAGSAAQPPVGLSEHR